MVTLFRRQQGSTQMGDGSSEPPEAAARQFVPRVEQKLRGLAKVQTSRPPSNFGRWFVSVSG
jgi:hypothetical protein